jgi:hypothetical protein
MTSRKAFTFALKNGLEIRFRDWRPCQQQVAEFTTARTRPAPELSSTNSTPAHNALALIASIGHWTLVQLHQSPIAR